MSGPAELAVAAGVIVDAGLKVSVLLGLGWAATRLLRRASAAQRHAVWVVTFAALPLLPLLAVQRGPEIALDAPWLVGVWAVGFAFFVARIARRIVLLELLRRQAAPGGSGPGPYQSDRVSGPITWGLFRPIILFPRAVDGWSSAHVAAALAHERAHIARLDWAVHIAAQAVCAVFWFHPLVWVAHRDLSRQAEFAADDAVLRQGLLPSDYASLLIALTAAGSSRGALAAGSSFVGSRVRALLDTRSRSPRRWITWTIALLLACLVVPTLGSWPTWAAPEQALTCAPGPAP